jgi:hypothetical protein
LALSAYLLLAPAYAAQGGSICAKASNNAQNPPQVEEPDVECAAFLHDQQPARQPAPTQQPSVQANTQQQSIPINGKLQIASAPISAAISVWDTPSVNRIIEHLVDTSCMHSKELQELDKQVDHFKSAPVKTIAASKDLLNLSTHYQGIGPSARVGKLVLDDDDKIKNLSTAEYERQRYIDKVHAQVVSSMMQIALGLGIKDKGRRQDVLASGYLTLQNLVGEEAASQTLKAMTPWLGKVRVPDDAFEKPVWDTLEHQEKLRAIITSAAQRDPVIIELVKKVNAYAHPSKLKRASSTVVDTTLSGISFLSPGFAIPIAAEGLLNAYILSTGGSEEHKLEKELIFSKRIQSRLKVIEHEATMAVDNYRLAQVTRNESLLAFSQACIADMTSKDVAAKVLGPSPARPAHPVLPEIEELTTDDHEPLPAEVQM